jgi:hypothetical protein
MGALLAYPTIAEEDQPLYDGKQASQKRHLTVIDDRAVDHVIEQCGFTAAGIYTLLERRANRHGVCVNISYQGLADKGGLSRRQVIRLMQDLQTAGFVEVRERVMRGRHTENEFFLPHHFSAPASGDMAPDINDGVVTWGGDTSGDMVVTSSGDMTGPSTFSSDTGGDTSGDTLNKNSNHVSSPSTQENVPTSSDAGASPNWQDRPQTNSVPFTMLWAIFHEQGQSVYELSEGERTKQCAVTGRLSAKANLTEDQFRAITRWLRGWMSGVDALDIERQLPKWRAAGSPTEADKKPSSKPPAHNSPRSTRPVY